MVTNIGLLPIVCRNSKWFSLINPNDLSRDTPIYFHINCVLRSVCNGDLFLERRDLFIEQITDRDMSIFRASATDL